MEQRMEMTGGGTLFWRQEGTRVLLRAERPADGQGLYKVWLCREGAERFLLGTLAPEGRKLCLFRSVARGELERAGCWPVEEARTKLVFRFQTGGGWYRENQPGAMFRDPLLRAQAREPMLCQKTENGFSLAAPVCTDRPMPLTVLACLADLERLDGSLCWVWHFDRMGQPVPAHKREKVKPN